MYLNGFEDRCIWTWDEERKRLMLSFNEIIKMQEVLNDFNQDLKDRIGGIPKIANYVYPSRAIFRFNTLKYFMQKHTENIIDKKTFTRWVQFIWPLYIPNCSDGCQICTEIHKGCQM